MADHAGRAGGAAVKTKSTGNVDDVASTKRARTTGKKVEVARTRKLEDVMSVPIDEQQVGAILEKAVAKLMNDKSSYRGVLPEIAMQVRQVKRDEQQVAVLSHEHGMRFTLPFALMATFSSIGPYGHYIFPPGEYSASDPQSAKYESVLIREAHKEVPKLDDFVPSLPVGCRTAKQKAECPCPGCTGKGLEEGAPPPAEGVSVLEVDCAKKHPDPYVTPEMYANNYDIIKKLIQHTDLAFATAIAKKSVDIPRTSNDNVIIKGLLTDKQDPDYSEEAKIAKLVENLYTPRVKDVHVYPSSNIKVRQVSVEVKGKEKIVTSQETLSFKDFLFSNIMNKTDALAAKAQTADVRRALMPPKFVDIVPFNGAPAFSIHPTAKVPRDIFNTEYSKLRITDVFGRSPEQFDAQFVEKDKVNIREVLGKIGAVIPVSVTVYLPASFKNSGKTLKWTYQIAEIQLGIPYEIALKLQEKRESLREGIDMDNSFLEMYGIAKPAAPEMSKSSAFGGAGDVDQGAAHDIPHKDTPNGRRTLTCDANAPPKDDHEKNGGVETMQGVETANGSPPDTAPEDSDFGSQ